MSGSLKVLLVVNVDWFYWSHRRPIAHALRAAGHEVVIAAGSEGGDFQRRIEAEGFRFVPLRMSRGGRSLATELSVLRELISVYRREAPDVVHQVSIKPMLYGSIAARIVGIPHIVNAVSGLGYAFSSGGLAARVRRWVTQTAYRLAWSAPEIHVIFQNPDHQRDFAAARTVPMERSTVIRGSGVDPDRFRPTEEPKGVPTVLFASRPLLDKGILELLEAGDLLRSDGRTFRIVVAGRVDQENPRGIDEATLETWAAEGRCEWRGSCDDMPRLLAESNVVVLPSHHEGLPKILLEAAAARRAMVATDIPGCREIARHGENAVLVPPRDAKALAAALAALMDNDEARRDLGNRGREIAVTEFSTARVAGETIALYEGLTGAVPKEAQYGLAG